MCRYVSRTFFFWPLNSGWGHMDSGLKLGFCFISYSTLAFWFNISRFTTVLPFFFCNAEEKLCAETGKYLRTHFSSSSRHKF